MYAIFFYWVKTTSLPDLSLSSSAPCKYLNMFEHRISQLIIMVLYPFLVAFVQCHTVKPFTTPQSLTTHDITKCIHQGTGSH